MNRFVAFLCLYIFQSTVSLAAVTIDVVESGSDVVATATGDIDLTSLSFVAATSFSSGTVVSSGTTHLIQVGPANLPNRWGGAIPPATVFSTGGIFSSSFDSGSSVGAFMIEAVTDDGIYVPVGYISGSAINGTSTWSSQTLAGLALIPGTYVWTWGSGGTADSLTLNIGGAAPPTTTTTTTTTTAAPTTTTTAAPTTTTTTTAAPTTTTTAATTTTTAATTTTTAATTTTTTVVSPTARPVPVLGVFGIPLLAGIMAVIGMLGFYRRR